MSDFAPKSELKDFLKRLKDSPSPSFDSPLSISELLVVQEQFQNILPIWEEKLKDKDIEVEEHHSILVDMEYVKSIIDKIKEFMEKLEQH